MTPRGARLHTKKSLCLIKAQPFLRAFFLSVAPDRADVGDYRSGLARSNDRNSRLPRSTAESIAACADFLPAKACSNSSSITSRIKTNDPSRSPREFWVGGFRVICSIDISVSGLL